MAEDERSDEAEESTDPEGSPDGKASDEPSPESNRGEDVGSDDGTRDEGIDVANLVNHVVYVAALFAVSGLGFGIVVALLSQFGGDATVVEGTLGRQTTAGFTEAVINIGITVALFFPLFLAPVTGLVVNLSIDEDLTALFAATGGVLLGAVLFYVLVGYTGGLQFPTRTAARGGEYTYVFVLRRGLVNSLLVGLVSGAVAGISAVVGQYLE